MKTANLDVNQKLRLSAIELQLMALDAQSKVLKNISVEHKYCTDIRPHVRRVICPENHVEQATRLVETLRATLKKMARADAVQRAVLIEQFQKTVRIFKVESASMVEPRLGKAYDHLEHALHHRGNVEPEESVREQQVRAHRSCFCAETGQIQTFVGQLNAMADLCLEVLFKEGDGKEEDCKTTAI